ncbi:MULTISPECIES: stalk domain-containing protein [Brevibacillus]|uniref:Copper amine oxidase N-terminal domain-containing protein n=1 Tax=Brevibacillus invocatus TaxID=173959 RepID=A0A3M8BYR0_9BACL|nr:MULTISPECIES: stalk domain-containing protein [Brevibacillus]MCM3079370.1 copper amine oxidase N-terminal domain-containing protein [Brevibacillus invocatus]MCM3429578.1 copper amine oxidase N-terminal domain-containing protein [Brevibacillus invocatus]MDH4619017.1 copper amine oxidase N-terminal domain-containing protein [Brevibacillus sp. AY1]RNB68474.1 copper amine oxidase N-terminal domain-containing protein [Brevibacillus invocatus]
MFKKHYLATAAAGLLLATAVIPSGASAEVATKNLQAKYNNIKVLYNGYQVSTPVEPFIVNGTTYIPLRMMAGVFNKDITWDGTNYTINVLDKPDTGAQAQLAVKDAEITRLKNQIAALNEEIQDLEDELDDDDDDDFDDELADLEEELNDDWGDFEELEWEITLDGDDEDDIEVEIEIDLSDWADEFDDLSESRKEKLVQNIIDDIWDVFEADITGYIIDSDEDEELYEFEADYDDDLYFEEY